MELIIATITVHENKKRGKRPAFSYLFYLFALLDSSFVIPQGSKSFFGHREKNDHIENSHHQLDFSGLPQQNSLEVLQLHLLKYSGQTHMFPPPQKYFQNYGQGHEIHFLFQTASPTTKDTWTFLNCLHPQEREKLLRASH